MIFISRNEKGIPKYELIMKGLSTVTRRPHPQPVGAIRAVQPGRGKKGVGYIQIISCMEHMKWLMGDDGMHPIGLFGLEDEAKREGFETWAGLMAWFNEHEIDINSTYRIEFILIEE